MYPGPNVRRHGKSLWLSPIARGYLWVTIPNNPKVEHNTMGTLLGVHPSLSLDLGKLLLMVNGQNLHQLILGKILSISTSAVLLQVLPVLCGQR